MFRRRASLRLGLCTRVARIMTVPPPQAAVSTERDAVFKARGAAGPAAPPGRCQLLSLSLSLSADAASGVVAAARRRRPPSV